MDFAMCDCNRLNVGGSSVPPLWPACRGSDQKECKSKQLVRRNVEDDHHSSTRIQRIPGENFALLEINFYIDPIFRAASRA